VTIVAIVARRDVARRLAIRASAVVTSPAISGYGHVVHVEDGTPGRRGVAAVAGFSGGHVAGRLHRRQHRTNLRVASNTSWIRALENTAGVTAVAGDVLVRTIQFKACCEVVE